MDSVSHSLPSRLLLHHLGHSTDDSASRLHALLLGENDGDTDREFGRQLDRRKGERRVAVRDLSRNLTGGVESVRGGDDGAERHDGEADDRDVYGVRRENEDDVASPYSDVMVETLGDTIDGSPEIGEA